MDIATILSLGIENGFAMLFIGGGLLFLVAVGKRILRLIDIWIAKQGKKTPDQIQELNEEDSKVDKEINNILFDILQKYQPDRVMVLQYHNGSYYNSGQHMKYISCTHEQPNIGVMPGVMDFQKIPSAIFQPVNSPMIEGEDRIIFKDVFQEVEEDTRSQFLRQVYKNLNFKSYYAFALRTHEGHLIGKVTLVGLHRKLEYTTEQLNKIHGHTAKIESLLNYNRLR